MIDRVWPQPLKPVSGPFRPDRVLGVRDGMGPSAPIAAGLVDSGIASPDMVAGMSLILMLGQPRTAAMKADGRSSSTDGGVWVREQATFHRPLSTTDVFEVTGSTTGRYVRRGRRYGTTMTETRSESGDLVASNLTTGLLEYGMRDDSEDEVEGVPLEDTPTPQPDRAAAAMNPHLDGVLSAEVGTVFGGNEVTITLEMMVTRETAQSDNPIHSDPERAKAAGLSRPIAGGAHVMAYALEPVMTAWGAAVFLHGSKIDVRWKAPTHCDTRIIPTAKVASVTERLVTLDLQVELADGSIAMVGTVSIPK